MADEIRITVVERCIPCNGVGSTEHKYHYTPCDNCGGTGKITGSAITIDELKSLLDKVK